MKKMDADLLLEGSIDVHCHCYPEFSNKHGMRLDDVENYRLAAAAKMKGIVLKSHMWPTIGRIYQMQDKVEGINMWSSIAMNTSAGGVKPWIAESALEQGVKVIWLPTWSARNDIERGGFSKIMKGILPTANKLTPEDGLYLLDENGALLNDVKEVIALAKDYDVAVFTGHISPKESMAVAHAAKDIGFTKLLLTHPDSNAVGGTVDHCREFANMDFFVETTFLGLMPAFWRISVKDLVSRIHDIGAEHWVLSTDSFFEWCAPTCEMMRMCIGTMLSGGCTFDEVDLMVRKNPAFLLNA
ncbi:MAG: DUF6282 family protein [Clostridiaceae bacterium]|nr:DUF6282 family protein [Clostridiaceae bacterium]